MTARSLRRAWPAVAVCSLLVLAAAAPAPDGARPAPPSQAAALCDPYTQAGPGDSTVGFGHLNGIVQPLPDGITLAVCSLHVQGTGWGSVNVRMLEWDPVALAPDPGTIALRTAYCDPSDLNYYTDNSLQEQAFVPPIVSRSLPGVAEPPRTTLAMEVISQSYYNYPFLGYYEPAGDPAMPSAFRVASDGSRTPISGAHPVVAHTLCDGGASFADLRVAQSVRRTDAQAPVAAELVQRFRVPEPVDVRWLELAVSGVAGSASAEAPAMPDPPPVTVGIIDATGLGDPPATMPAAMVEAMFYTYFYKQPGPRWASPLDFDHTIRLMPERDYWLYLRSAQGYQFLSRALTGGEDATFTSAIGAFHSRGLPIDPWSPVPDQALAFKIVGVPTAPLSVPPRAGFELRVSPNPSRDVAEVAWSGAVGPVRLEVFDARGRRVAAGSGGAAGTWRLETRGAGSRPLPAGVYFVHARDTEGGHPVERLVIVR